MHLLANVVPDGWKKCREVIDEHPYLAVDEYQVDCHEELNKSIELLLPTESVLRIESVQVAPKIMPKDGAGKLPGLYTGENGLHIVRASPWLPRGGLVHVPVAHQRAWLSLCRRPPHGRRS